MRAEMHPRAVVPKEERLGGLDLAFQEIDGGVGRLVINVLHALLGKGAGILDLLFAHASPARLLGGIVSIGGVRMDHAARAELLHKIATGIRALLGFLFGIQVVEIAEELVEAMYGRQELIQIAEMVLAELSGGVAVRLEQLG